MTKKYIKKQKTLIHRNPKDDFVTEEEEFFLLLKKHDMCCDNIGGVARLIHRPTKISILADPGATKNYGYRLYMVKKLLDKLKT